jgi:hypothetical protein
MTTITVIDHGMSLSVLFINSKINKYFTNFLNVI